MQYLSINSDTTLADLSDRVGDRNVETFLAINGLTRSPNIGEQFTSMIENILQTGSIVDWQRKSTILNKFSGDSDIFEEAALLDNNSWKVLDALETFPDRLKVPETITLPSSTDILGNGQGVDSRVYENAMNSLANEPHTIDPGIFNSYSTIQNTQITGSVTPTSTNTTLFNLPW